MFFLKQQQQQQEMIIVIFCHSKLGQNGYGFSGVRLMESVSSRYVNAVQLIIGLCNQK